MASDSGEHRRELVVDLAGARVGARIRTRGVSFGPGRSSAIATAGMPNASVFPEPVGARPMTSRPSTRSGMVSAWMVNGCVIPEALSASTMAAGTPSSANDVGRGTRLPYWPPRWVSLTPTGAVAAGSGLCVVSVDTHGCTVHAVALTGRSRLRLEPAGLRTARRRVVQWREATAHWKLSSDATPFRTGSGE